MSYITMDVFCVSCIVFLAIIGFLTVKLLRVKAKEKKNPAMSETNCDYIQGWYYSKALPETEAEAYAKAYMEKTC